MAQYGKHYVVWKGRKPGVYATWAEAVRHIYKFGGARYKAYPSREEAEAAFAAGPDALGGAPLAPVGQPTAEAWSVDGACSGNPGPMEYRCVHVGTKAEIFREGPMLGTNNLGEFLGLVEALRRLHTAGDAETPIYTDSLTARAWVRDRKVGSTLPRNPHTAEVWRRTDEALYWLRTHRFKTPILTWETKTWGEIPADFGRK